MKNHPQRPRNPTQNSRKNMSKARSTFGSRRHKLRQIHRTNPHQATNAAARQRSPCDQATDRLRRNREVKRRGFDRQKRWQGGRCGGGARGVASVRGSLMPEAGLGGRRWREGTGRGGFGSHDPCATNGTLLGRGSGLSLHHGPALPQLIAPPPNAALPIGPKPAPALSKPHAPRPPQTKRRAETSPLRQMGARAGSCGPKYATPKSTAGENPVTGSGKVKQSQAGVPLNHYHRRATTIGSVAPPSSTSNTVAGNAAPCPQYPASQTRCAPSR